MNQRVDIERYLEEFRSQIAGLNKSVKDLSDENARLNRRIEAQNVEIKGLKAENSTLKERLSKYENPEPPKNFMSETPDEIEDIQPNYCRECGRDLSDIDGEEEYSEECVGFKISPVIRRTRYMKKTCTCVCSNSMEPVKGRNTVYIASEVKALTVYLNVAMCMPYNRIKSFIETPQRRMIFHVGMLSLHFLSILFRYA